MFGEKIPIEECRERARLERWKSKGVARVIHRRFGEIVVPCGSKLSAIMNAAEIWRCDSADVMDAEVWAAGREETPAAMPTRKGRVRLC